MKKELFKLCKNIDGQKITIDKAKHEIDKIVDHHAFLYTTKDAVNALKCICTVTPQDASNVIMRYGMEDGVTIIKKDHRHWLTADGLAILIDKLQDTKRK